MKKFNVLLNNVWLFFIFDVITIHKVYNIFFILCTSCYESSPSYNTYCGPLSKFPRSFLLWNATQKFQRIPFHPEKCIRPEEEWSGNYFGKLRLLPATRHTATAETNELPPNFGFRNSQTFMNTTPFYLPSNYMIANEVVAIFLIIRNYF